VSIFRDHHRVLENSKVPDDLLEKLTRKCGVIRPDVIRAAIVELLKTIPLLRTPTRIRRIVIG